MGVIIIEFVFGLVVGLFGTFEGLSENNKILAILGLIATISFLVLNIMTITNPAYGSALINSTYAGW